MGLEREATDARDARDGFIVSGAVAPEYERFVLAARRKQRLRPPPKGLEPGWVGDPVVLDVKEATALIQVAAKRAAGLDRPTKRTEVLWVEGDSQLAIGVAGIRVSADEGLLGVVIPVRCDQIGSDRVRVVFGVGSPERPAGLFASTFRKPIGPRLVVDAWSDALVAFAWQCVLGVVTGLAGAVGKDASGASLVPAELTVTKKAIAIVPMARHRLPESSRLSDAERRR